MNISTKEKNTVSTKDKAAIDHLNKQAIPRPNNSGDRLAFINPQEMALLDQLTDGGAINKGTGLVEFDVGDTDDDTGFGGDDDAALGGFEDDFSDHFGEGADAGFFAVEDLLSQAFSPDNQSSINAIEALFASQAPGASPIDALFTSPQVGLPGELNEESLINSVSNGLFNQDDPSVVAKGQLSDQLGVDPTGDNFGTPQESSLLSGVNIFGGILSALQGLFGQSPAEQQAAVEAIIAKGNETINAQDVDPTTPITNELSVGTAGIDALNSIGEGLIDPRGFFEKALAAISNNTSITNLGGLAGPLGSVFSNAGLGLVGGLTDVTTQQGLGLNTGPVAGNNPGGVNGSISVAGPGEGVSPGNLDVNFDGSLPGVNTNQDIFGDSVGEFDDTGNETIKRVVQFINSDIFKNSSNDPARQSSLLNQLLTTIDAPETTGEVIPGSFRDLFNRRNDPVTVPESFQDKIEREYQERLRNNRVATPEEDGPANALADFRARTNIFGTAKEPLLNAVKTLPFAQIVKFGDRFNNIFGGEDSLDEIQRAREVVRNDVFKAAQTQADSILNVQAAIDAFRNAQTGFNDLIEERGFTGRDYAVLGRQDLQDQLFGFTAGPGQVDRFNSLLNADTGRARAELALTNTENRFKDFGNAQISSIFPEGGFDLDQSIIDSIVEDRIGQGSKLISNQQARGNFNPIGAQNANENLQTQKPAIRQQVSDVANSFVPQVNERVNDIRGRASEANNSFTLGDDLFNINAFTDERDTFLNDQNTGFRSQVDDAIGSNPLFDIESALSAGRRTQGVVSGGPQGSGILDTLAARQAQGGSTQQNNRGISTTGSGAF